MVTECGHYLCKVCSEEVVNMSEGCPQCKHPLAIKGLRDDNPLGQLVALSKELDEVFVALRKEKLELGRLEGILDIKGKDESSLAQPPSLTPGKGLVVEAMVKEGGGSGESGAGMEEEEEEGKMEEEGGKVEEKKEKVREKEEGAKKVEEEPKKEEEVAKKEEEEEVEKEEGEKVEKEEEKEVEKEEKEEEGVKRRRLGWRRRRS